MKVRRLKAKEETAWGNVRVKVRQEPYCPPTVTEMVWEKAPAVDKTRLPAMARALFAALERREAEEDARQPAPPSKAARILSAHIDRQMEELHG